MSVRDDDPTHDPPPHHTTFSCAHHSTTVLLSRLSGCTGLFVCTGCHRVFLPTGTAAVLHSSASGFHHASIIMMMMPSSRPQPEPSFDTIAYRVSCNSTCRTSAFLAPAAHIACRARACSIGRARCMVHPVHASPALGFTRHTPHDSEPQLVLHFRLLSRVLAVTERNLDCCERSPV